MQDGTYGRYLQIVSIQSPSICAAADFRRCGDFSTFGAVATILKTQLIYKVVEILPCRREIEATIFACNGNNDAAFS